MFPPPDEHLYLPLTDFPGGDEAKLRKDIDQAIAKLNLKANEFSASRDFAKKHLELISQAEAHALHQGWADAHETIWEATCSLNRAIESRAAWKFRFWVAAYYALWLLLLWVVSRHLRELEVAGEADAFVGAAYWRYGVMGALGGLTVAIWGLTKHTVDLDFDRSFSIWYWLKPVLGGITGLVAVLAVMGGLFAVQGKQKIESGMALYILAFLAGFSERLFIRILDRVMTSLLGGDESDSSPAKPVRTPSKSRRPREGENEAK